MDVKLWPPLKLHMAQGAGVILGKLWEKNHKDKIDVQ